MDRALEKLLGECNVGSRKAQALADDLETMFEMWTGYMTSRVGVATFLERLECHDDRSFNIDGYQPTIMPVTQSMIEGMTSIGVDVIRPNPTLYEHADVMVVEEAMSILWLIFTVVEQGHPLKGLRYVVGFRDGELTLSCDDPMFTSTYDDEHCQTGCQGIYIDKRERFLRAVRGDIFND